MRCLLLVLLLPLVVCAQLNPGNPFFSAGLLKPSAGGGGGGCTTAGTLYNPAFPSASYFGDSAGTAWIAVKVAATASESVCRIDVPLGWDGGALSGNITAYLYTDIAGAPGVVVANGTSAAVAASTLADTPASISFTGFNTSVSSGTSYWLVMQKSSVSGSAYVEYTEGNPDGLGDTRYSADGITWGATFNTYRPRLQFYH